MSRWWLSLSAEAKTKCRGQRIAPSRNQSKRFDVLRAHDAEVASVEAGYGGDAETLGERDQAGVYAAKVLVGVALGEFCDSHPVT